MNSPFQWQPISKWMEAACAKTTQGRKRVYLGLGHKRGSLSWFSPFFSFLLQVGLTVLVLGLTEMPTTPWRRTIVFFQWQTVRCNWHKDREGGPSGNERSVWGESRVWDPISQHNLLGGLPFMDRIRAKRILNTWLPFIWEGDTGGILCIRFVLILTEAQLLEGKHLQWWSVCVTLQKYSPFKV